RGSCLRLRRIQMAACLSNVLQHSIEIRMVFPDPREWYPWMEDSHCRNLQTYHFPLGQALLSQHPQPLDRFVTRPAFCDRRNRLCRFSPIGVLVKLFDKDRHLHGFLLYTWPVWRTHPMRLSQSAGLYHAAPQTQKGEFLLDLSPLVNAALVKGDHQLLHSLFRLIRHTNHGQDLPFA